MKRGKQRVCECGHKMNRLYVHDGKTFKGTGWICLADNTVILDTKEPTKAHPKE